MDRTPARTVERVRHALKFRLLRVAEILDLTPSLRRIVLEGETLHGFVSLGFDDHVKLFPPGPDGAVILPTEGPDGPVFAEPRPPSRDYTPRRYEADRDRLTVDFVLGHPGPATDWAAKAVVGDPVGIGGPRGSRVVPLDYATHVLIGDETALPAIARRLEELPAHVRAVVIVEVDGADGRIPLDTRAQSHVVWVERAGRRRGDPTLLVQAAEGLIATIDPADAYVWAAAEAEVAARLRAVLTEQGFDPLAMRIAGYWTLGGTSARTPS